MQHSDRVRLFVREIWSWYARHKRELPWRDLSIADDDERAYRILVSEVMLQQTQVPRVIVIFKRFLRRFPTLRSLADASNKDVLIAWRGMGYNSRALRLRDAARHIIQRVTPSGAEGRHAQHGFGSAHHDTLFPRSMEELLAIPGIGPYTAAAIRNFAWNLPTPCIDTNIRRILHRTFVGPEKADGTWTMNDKKLMTIAQEVLMEACRPFDSAQGDTLHDARNWHAALMDFGSLVQTKNNPRWEICPLTDSKIMKTTKKSFERALCHPERSRRTRSAEPGRMVGAKFIPNRIFRGKIVEALRTHDRGLTLDQLGRGICMDWGKEHKLWLKSLITKLIQDHLLMARGKVFLLKED